MNIKNIIFTISALIVLISGSLLFEHFQEKIKDSSWLIVVSKIAVAIILLVVYGIILKWVSGLCHIEWKGN